MADDKNLLEELADSVGKLVNGEIIEGTVGAITSLASGIDELSLSAAKAKNEVKDFSDTTKNGIPVLLETDIKFKALANTMGLIPLIGDRLTESAKGMQTGLRTLSNLGENQTKIFDALGNALSLKTGVAFQELALILKTAASEQQKFEIEMINLGQNDKTIERVGRQAKVLAELGISYDMLKTATKDTITMIDSSIAVNDKQKGNFERNRYVIQDLMAVNKKFGIENQQTADLVNLFQNAMGGGVEMTEKFSDGLQKFAIRTGQAPAAVFKSFTESMDRFSTMSAPKALESFEKLAAYAKRAGTDMKTIQTNMEQFDDLSQGYEKMGKLNRLLMQFGSSIDPIAFMRADDVARTQMIVEAVSKTQGKFANLTTDAARRQVAKALSEGAQLPYEIALGIASGKGTEKDLLEALKMKTPEITDKAGKPDIEKYTDKEKADRLKSVMSFDDAQKTRDQLLQLTNSTKFLANAIRESDKVFIGQTAKMYENFDKTLFKAVVTQDTKYFTDFKNDVKNAVTTGLRDVLVTGRIETSTTGQETLTKIIFGP